MSRAGAPCELAALAREERAQARDRENEERYGLKAGFRAEPCLSSKRTPIHRFILEALARAMRPRLVF